MTKPVEVSTAKREPNANLIATLKYIRREPKLFDMNNWGRKTACGTAACLAGTACIVNGDRPLWEIVGVEQSFDHVKARTTDHGYDYWASTPVEVQTRAAELLGLTEMEADYVFYEDFENFEEVVKHLEDRYHFDFSGVNWDDNA